MSHVTSSTVLMLTSQYYLVFLLISITSMITFSLPATNFIGRYNIFRIRQRIWIRTRETKHGIRWERMEKRHRKSRMEIQESQ